MSAEEQIRLLIGLQKLDNQIFRLKKELAHQPIFIQTLEGQFKQKEAGLKKVEEELKAATLKRREKELDLESKEVLIKKMQGQLYQIKTNKEYQTMEKEIASQKADASVLEEDVLKILDQIDTYSKEVGRQRQALEQERQKFSEEKNIVECRTKEIQASLAALTAQRTALAQTADKKFLAKYERILHTKESMALVPVLGGSCGGCNINLPPQVINEIKMKQELIFCGSCARILYIDDDGTA